MKDNLNEFTLVTDFLKSQRLAIKPDPERLKQALVQGALLADDEDDWGRLQPFWKPLMGAGLAVFGGVILLSTPKNISDEVQIAQDWESEFMSEIADFYETKAELEPLYTQPLFSSDNRYQS